MTAETIKDIVDGRARYTFEKGWECERVAIVKGIAGNGHAKMIAAVIASGFELGDKHPARASCLLYDISPEIIDSETVRLTLSYSDSYLRGFNTAEIGATVTQEETNQDAAGIGIYAGYPGESNQGRFISKFMPEMTISMTVLEYANPQWKAANYVGKVNSGPWSLDPYSTARTWLCTGITGHSPDHGTTWWVTYTFLKRPNNFDVKVVWVDENGFPPPDAVPYSWQIYTMINFNGLGLS